MNPPPIRPPVGTWIGCGLCIAFATVCISWRTWAIVVDGAPTWWLVEMLWGLLHVPVATAAMLIVFGWLDLRGLLALAAAFGLQGVLLLMLLSLILEQHARIALFFSIVSLLHIVLTSRFFAWDFENYSRWYAARKRAAAESDAD